MAHRVKCLPPFAAVALVLSASALGALSSGCTGQVDGGTRAVPGSGDSGRPLGDGVQPGGPAVTSTGATATTGVAGDGTTVAAAGTAVSAGGAGASAGSTAAAGDAALDPEAPTPPAPGNPGSVIVRRLNHAEYNNTVRDLLGTSLRPADDFLTDDPGAGFDTVGAAASLSPAYVRDYEAAAHALIEDLYADSARLSQVVTCDVEAEGAACAESVVTAFARKAFRRPVSATEVQNLLTPFQTAQSLAASATEGLQNSLAAVLLSPAFIFKLEIDPDPTSTAPRRLNDYELATRLSYALWSTMPDDPLSAAADAGTLGTDAELGAQLDRMLSDPRSEALADNFAAQWLDFRKLSEHQVDPQLFREYTPQLVESMQKEASLFFLEFLNTDRPLNDFISGRFTYVDQTLADHYGLPNQGGGGGDMWLVDTSNEPRAGVMTLGAVLTTTSFTSRTSPVRRGQFVLDRLMCDEIPPPPPDVDVSTVNDAQPGQNLTFRERMEAHRENPACYGCHSLMDPIGFGLDNFDAIGRYRTEENGLPIDSTGELDGVPFSGAVELAALLSGDSRFGQCIAEKFMIFALGRYLNQVDDSTWIAHIAGTTRDTGGDLKTMIRTLVMSEAFRSRQAVVSTL